MLEQFNKILLPQGIEESFLSIKSHSENFESFNFGLDSYSFNYIFEEFISRGAIKIALLPSSGYINDLKTFDKIIKERTEIADIKLKNLELLNILFKPIANELQINIEKCKPIFTLNYQRSIVFNENNFIRKQLLKSFTIAYENIYPFLIGISSQMQVSLELSKTINALTILKNYCRESNSRKNCSMLIGILQTYRQIEIPVLKLQKSSASIEFVNNFKYFLKNELYKEYSFHSFSLGKIGAKISEIVDKMSRVLIEMKKKDGFTNTLDFGTKLITTSTGIPIPSYKVIDNLLKVESFSPPIINLSGIISSVKESWMQREDFKGSLDLGINIMQDSLDMEQPLEYTLRDSNMGNINMVFKMSSRFNGKGIITELVPSITLQSHQIDIFNEFHKSNFINPIHCKDHNIVIKFSDLKLDYHKSKFEIFSVPCCENNYIEIITKLFSFDKGRQKH